MRRSLLLLGTLLGPAAAPADGVPDPNAVEDPLARAARLARIADDRAKAQRRLALLPLERRIRADPPWDAAPREAEITLVAPHSAEFVTVRPFDGRGDPDPRAFETLGWLLRCRRTRALAPIEPRLVRILLHVAHTARTAVVVLSGYRAPGPGQRPGSFHGRGRAADIRIPGLSASAVRDLVWSLDPVRFGPIGVGFYPRSKFVHVDARAEAEHWVGR